MLWTVIVGATPASIACIILPRLGIYELNWIGPVTEVIWIPIIAYSIIRYRQMNIRTVITEVLAIAMTVIFFINIFVGQPIGLFGRVATFVVFLLLAIYLIHISLREANQREQLKDLNAHLSQKVAEQTKEIRHALEAEKHARLELEKLNDAKNQFIMITQHHLRTPVTSILWTLESTLQGAYGKIDDTVSEALEGARTAGKRLRQIVDDFLNISAIKVGTNILNISRKSLRPAVDDVLDELKPEIERMKVKVIDDADPAKWPELDVDFEKMREALLIVIENAVKYNRPEGTVKISTTTSDDKFGITVENTGLGINKEDMEKIGTSLFYRGKEAQKQNPIGMGIGLSVVKAIVKAHKGTFEIGSRDGVVRVGVRLNTF